MSLVLGGQRERPLMPPGCIVGCKLRVSDKGRRLIIIITIIITVIIITIIIIIIIIVMFIIIIIIFVYWRKPNGRPHQDT